MRDSLLHQKTNGQAVSKLHPKWLEPHFLGESSFYVSTRIRVGSNGLFGGIIPDGGALYNDLHQQHHPQAVDRAGKTTYMFQELVMDPRLFNLLSDYYI